MLPFDPLFRNPHWQTIAGHYWPRPSSTAWPLKSRFVQTEPGVQVLVQSQFPHSAPAPTPALVLVHGLEGSGSAGYIRGLAAGALARGWVAHRFHMRTCGGTEHLSNTLYHAGLTSDLHTVLRQIGPAFLVGFSLGGNVVLKLAGELGERGPELIRGICAVSTPLDLAACARRIAEPDNRLYELRFIRRMRARLLATGRFSASDFAGLRRLFDLDDRITAPAFGFRGAAEYYETQSAIHFLPRIRVPALLVQAKDDTFIPYGIFESAAVGSNPHIELVATGEGGHLGFLGRRPHRFWADRVILDWIGLHTSPQSP
jgi:predicted alpha/beta-fold hydrolase